MKKIIFFISLWSVVTLQAQSTVQVSGNGIVTMTPDKAIIKVRIENEGGEPKEIQRQTDETVNKVIQSLKTLNIDMKHVRTDYVKLNKNYDYQIKKYTYVANQAIIIELYDLSKYASLVQNLMNSGVNRIDDVIFTSVDEEKYQALARKKAMEVALQKAKEYTSVLNQKVGKAIHISENETHQPRPIMEMSMLKSSRSSDATATSVALGDMEVQAQVFVTFELL